MAGVSKFPQLSVAKASHGTPLALKGDKILPSGPLGQTIPRLMAGEQGQVAFGYTVMRGYRPTYAHIANGQQWLHRIECRAVTLSTITEVSGYLLSAVRREQEEETSAQVRF